MGQISVRGRGFAYRRNRAICTKTDKRQKYKAEPSKMHVNQQNLTSASLNVLLANGSLLTHGFDTLHKELSSDGHESDGNNNGTEANPRIGLGFLLCEFAFLLLEGIGGGWVELESIVISRRVV